MVFGTRDLLYLLVVTYVRSGLHDRFILLIYRIEPSPAISPHITHHGAAVTHTSTTGEKAMDCHQILATSCWANDQVVAGGCSHLLCGTTSAFQHGSVDSISWWTSMANGPKTIVSSARRPLPSISQPAPLLADVSLHMQLKTQDTAADPSPHDLLVHLHHWRRCHGRHENNYLHWAILTNKKDPR